MWQAGLACRLGVLKFPDRQFIHINSEGDSELMNIEAVELHKKHV